MSNKPIIPNIPNQKDYKNLTPFDLVLIQRFPFIEEDFDGINLYGILSKIKESLNNVIANEQIVTENQENVYNSFVDLHNFVEDYFNNLDVQEEINNKLDEMAESGVLQEIITLYLNSKAFFGFNTINDLKQATNLINGSYAKTLGYYVLNDNGGAFYKIRNITNDDIVDNATIIPLYDNNLIAELITNNANVKQFGAKGDGQTDDQLPIQNAINYVINRGGGTVYFPNGEYLINSSLLINTDKGLKITGNGERYTNKNSTLIFNCENSFNIQTPSYNFHIENINITNLLSVANYRTKLINLLSGGYFARSIFKNLTISNYYEAFNLTTPSGNDFTDGCIFENINFRTVYYCFKAKHLEASEINCCSAEPYINNFIELEQSGGVSITNCIMRSLPNANTTPSVAILSHGTSQNGRNVFIRNCVSEDSDIFAILTTPNTIIENCRYTINRIPLKNPIILGQKSGSRARNTTIKNLIVNYEVETTLQNVLLVTENTDISYGDKNITIQLLQDSTLFVEGLPLTVLNNNDSRRVVQSKTTNLLTSYNNKRIFYGSSSLKNEVKAPDGSDWLLNDILFCYYNSTGHERHNHVIGYIYTQYGSTDFEWLPITLGIDKMSYYDAKNTYTGVSIGQMSFDTTNNKPIWWNGTHWSYSDGTEII